MYLVDTNIWRERLLDPDKSESVRKFLDIVPSERLFISDFSFHSIGVILCKINKRDTLIQFTDDIFKNGDVSLLCLEPDDMPEVVNVIERYNLDFDDAYQYITAEKNDLALVSFDADFDRSERGKKNPEVIYTEFKREEEDKENKEGNGEIKEEEIIS